MNKATSDRPSFPNPIHGIAVALWVLGLLAMGGCGLTRDATPDSQPTTVAPENAAITPGRTIASAPPPLSSSRPADVEATVVTSFHALNAGPPAFPPATCPVTRAPESPFIPPAPYPEQPAAGFFWYGSGALWTEIPDDGRWHDLPYDAQHGYSQKIVFWSDGYDWQAEPQPALALEGRRLDAPAPPLDAAPANNAYHDDYGSFIMTGGSIPTEGCWEFTAHYKGAELMYVVWVAPEEK